MDVPFDVVRPSEPSISKNNTIQLNIAKGKTNKNDF